MRCSPTPIPRMSLRTTPRRFDNRQRSEHQCTEPKVPRKPTDPIGCPRARIPYPDAYRKLPLGADRPPLEPIDLRLAVLISRLLSLEMPTHEFPPAIHPPMIHHSPPVCRFLVSAAVILSTVFQGLVFAEQAESSPRKVQLVSDPTVSPDGKHVAMEWLGDIWIAPRSGGTPVRVTTHLARDSQPEFSPDSTELAFVSSRTGSNQIFVVPISLDEPSPTIGIPRQITFHTEGFQLHGWYPDGAHLIATGSRDHGWKYASRMIKVNVRERQAETILVDAIAANPSVSPDGKRILFNREGERWWRKGYTGERAAQVWMFDCESESFTELLHVGVDCYWPIWDGQHNAFFYTRGRDAGAALMRHDLDTGKDVEVCSFDDDSIVLPSVSSDGSILVFRHLFDLYELELGDKRPLKKRQPKKISIDYVGDSIGIDDQLRRELSSASDVAFSDDGLEILLTAGGDLWSMDTVLKEPRRLSETPGFESSPSLSPDGTNLVLVSVQDGRTDIWSVTRTDTDAFWWQETDLQWTRLTDDPAIESDVKISPDGKHIFYVRDEGDLWRMSIDGKKNIKLLDGFASPDYDVSSCGTYVAYSTSDDDFNQDVWITRADGTGFDGNGEPYNVSKHPDDDFAPRFSPDGKVLAFTGRRVETETDIYYVFLQADAAEETSRQRRLDEALETMKKKRASKKKSTEAPAKDGKQADEKTDDDDKDKDKPSDEDSKDDEGEDEDSDDITPIQIDFDGLDDRLRRISIGDSYETNLIWSPDSKKLAFQASIDGDRGLYTVEFPDELSPKKLTDSSIQRTTWSEKAGGLLGLVSGKPTKITDAGKSTSYAFNARQTYSRAARNQAAFEEAWRIMRDRWYDPKTGGRNWNAVRRKFADAARDAVDTQSFGEIVQLMLGELNGSHNGFYPTRDEPTPPRAAFTDTTAHLGVRFDSEFPGPGLRVQDVLPGGPADRQDSRLNVGDVITMIDGIAIDPEMDLTMVLNGPLDRDVVLTVAPKDKPEGDDEESNDSETHRVTMRPTTFGAARGQLYEKWLQDNRDSVDELSDGKLGYLHIRSMNMPSFYDFEEQLYRVGYGRDGLVIDVRDNGGGSTTDLLLTALTQPKHAITVPRGGGPGYPQSRMVYAVWQKPIIVLCNQNSFSNAEIFSHAIRNLGRGKLVGVQTAGGVISTGSVRIMDVGTMRMPFRGWFTSVDGKDMELNGALPHYVIWPGPGEIPAGKDRQLEKAVAVLLKECRREAKKNPEPELQYQTER